MNDSHLKRIALIIALGLAILAGSFYLIARPLTTTPVPVTSSVAPVAAPNPVPAASTTSNRPVITWTPASTTVTVSPGETKTVSLSFTSAKNVRRASVEISLELAPFVRAEPASFERIRKGEQRTLNIIVAPGASAALGTVTGTIQLRRGKVEQNDPDADEDDRRDAGKLLPQTLNVHVNVWVRFKDNSLGLTLISPPTFVPTRSTDPNQKQVAFSDSEDSRQRGIAPILVVNILDLPQGQTLRDFIRSFGIDDSAIEGVTVDGRQYLKWFESAGDGIGATSYSTLFSQNQVISISTPSSSFASSGAFMEVVSSLSF